jgi:poly-beta-1,6-N-acetyl-D-glucosamine synthase
LIIFLYILIALATLYNLSLLFFFFGLLRLPRLITNQQPKVSMIVACHNEQEHITPLLLSLALQTYPQEKFEIILANDVSTDETAARIETFTKNHPHLNIKTVTVQNRDQVISAKKNALAQAINVATGELLLFTDADCRPPSEWITSIVRYFSAEVGMVIGFSPYELPALAGLAKRLIAIDALSLAALAAGTTGWGRPATCSGRNLAYRKSVYREVAGFRDIQQFISGDDDLFLKLVMQKTEWQVRYAMDPETVVPTYLLKNGRQFFHQRLRHASKGFHYGWRMSSVLFGAWLFNFLLFTTLWTPHFKYALGLWAIKALAELLLLVSFAVKMRRLYYLWVWPIAAVLHVPYVILFGGLGPFLKFNWKETKPAC